MLVARRKLGFAIIACTFLAATGCADDSLSKGLLVAGGAGAGAYLGKKVAPNSGISGPVLGAGAGGLLGYMLGGSLGGKK